MQIPRRPALLGIAVWLCVASHPGNAAALADRLQREAPTQPTPTRQPLTSVQQNNGTLVMVGANGLILLSDANGTTQQAQVPVDLLLTSVCFVDARNGWAVGHDGVIINSSDAGATWTTQIDGAAIGKLMKLSAEQRIAQLQAETPSDDVNRALENANFMLDDVNAGLQSGPSRPLLDIWFRNADEGWAVGAYGTVLHTVDGGKQWQFMEGLDDPERLHLNAIVGLADGTLLIAGEGGRIYRSIDGGNRWTALPATTPASLYKLIALRDGQVFALGFGGTLLSSKDQGQHWQLIPLPTHANLYGGAQLPDGGLALVGQAGTVLLSQDSRNFKRWQGLGKAALLGIAMLSDGQIALIGSAGLSRIALSEIEANLQ